MKHSWAPAIELVSELVRFPSVSRASNKDVSQFVADRLASLGFSIEWLSYIDSEGIEKISVVAKRGEGVGGVAYLAHTDVVPADDWAADCGPFEPTVRDGRIYGRGTCDMKGSLAAAITAVSGIASDSAEPIYFVVTSDEEVGMHGAKLVDAQSKFFEEMVVNKTVGIIGEPTLLQVVHGHKGGLRFQVTSRGVSAHTSTNDGVNANYALIPVLPEILKLRQETEQNTLYHDLSFDPPTFTWNMTLLNEPQAMNVTPSLARLNNFLRLMPGVDEGPIVEQVKKLCVENGLEFRIAERLGPWGVAADSWWIQTMLDIVGERGICSVEQNSSGNAPEAVSSPRSKSVCYATDAAVLQRLDRMMVCGPGDIQQAHRSDEWLSLQQLEQGVKVYTEAFMRFTQSSSRD